MNSSSIMEAPLEGQVFAAGSPAEGDVEPPALVHRIIVASILLIACVVGTLGNLLVIFSVVVSKKLRTPTNAFVVNLAVADLLTSVFLLFLALSYIIDDNPAIPHWLCGTSMGFIFSCLCCSLYTLASIGLNRLLLVTQPTYVCRKLFQPKVLIVWISSIWVFSIGLVVIPPALDVGQLGYDEPYHSCGGVSSHPKVSVYEAIIVLGIYPVPLVVILICYVVLYANLRLHGRRMMRGAGEPKEASSTATSKSNTTERRRMVLSPSASDAPNSSQTVTSPTAKIQSFDVDITPPRSREMTPDITPDVTPRPIRRQLTTASESCTPTLGQMRRSTRKKISKRHLQITKNLFYVVLAFLICLTPYFMVFILGAEGAAVIYAAAAIFFNSCVNPFVYATKHPHFKKVFKCILLCQLQSVPEPASFLRAVSSVVNE